MSERPVIGVSFGSERHARAEKEAHYLRALERAGAEPLVVRPGREAEVPDLLRKVHGWLFTGGDDIAPELYGEEPHAALGEVQPDRDRMDLLLARGVLAQGLPTLGVCLGMQMLTVAAGGTLVQDISSQVEGATVHAKGTRHPVRVEPGTRLASIVGAPEVEVNSYHHQSVKRLGRGFRAAAVAPDGVLEAMERPGEPFVLAVQWHPEREGCAPPACDGLFAAFVRAASDRIPSRSGIAP
jgi:putative glutamine amidotransferase